MQDSSLRETMVCPLNGKLCLKGTREDFPRDAAGGKTQCRWWIHLFGKDPQTEKTIDQFDCAVAWIPTTSIEGAQMTRQLNASLDAHRNEMGTNLGKVADVLKQGALAILSNQRLMLDGRNGHHD